MRQRKRSIEALERILFGAHRAAAGVTAGGAWQASLMSDIRRLVPAWQEDESIVAYNRIAWRFLAAACAVALILFVSAYATGIVDRRDLVVTILQDPLSGYMP